MKKRIGFYMVFWAVLFALFQLIVWLSPNWVMTDRYTSSFWIGYAFIDVALVGQLICACIALLEENAQKVFYRVPLVSTSYTGLVVTFVVGGLCMLVAPLPYWVGILVCAVVLAANVLAIIKAAAVINEVERIDQKVKVQTFFIKSLTVDAEGLLARAKNDEVKAVCKKVYEAVRYSDPMSSELLASVESQITIRFAALRAAVEAENTGDVCAAAEEVVILLEDRNSKCKMLK